MHAVVRMATGLFAAALLAFGTAQAADTLRYLAPDQADFRSLLPAPPAESSAEQKAELDELHRIAQEASAERKERAAWDDAHENITLFNVVFDGTDLSAIPSVKALFDDVQNDRKIATDMAKTYFKRKRPWIQDPTIKACGGMRDPLSSFPSGHAASAYAMGNVLAAMLPEMTSAILERAADFAESRLVCGMHFRSDILGGQVLGTAVADRLLDIPDFRTRADAAAEDLRAATK